MHHDALVMAFLGFSASSTNFVFWMLFFLSFQLLKEALDPIYTLKEICFSLFIIIFLDDHISVI